MQFFQNNLLSALERMFEKAKSLVGNDGFVLEKPGATDGSYNAAWSHFLVSLLIKEGLLNATEFALIAEKKTVNMSLQ